MKSLVAILRVLLLGVVAFILLEKTATGSQETLWESPVLLLVWAGILLFATAVEVSVFALRSMLFHTLSEDAKARYQSQEKQKAEQRKAFWGNLYKKLTKSKPIEKEGEIVLDHNYDGIRELDNKLPPWWVYSFYITIVFAVIYMVRYHVFDGATQEEEYNREVAAAEIAVAEYKKKAKNLVDANTVELLTDETDLKAGEAIFVANCVACHRADGGGGIGPNLTDEFWILGGGISNIFEVISEGGRPGKGMIAWKNDLKPMEIAQVSSYIISLEGTNPPDAKEPQGDPYVEPVMEEKAAEVLPETEENDQ